MLTSYLQSPALGLGFLKRMNADPKYISFCTYCTNKMIFILLWRVIIKYTYIKFLSNLNKMIYFFVQWKQTNKQTKILFKIYILLITFYSVQLSLLRQFIAKKNSYDNSESAIRDYLTTTPIALNTKKELQEYFSFIHYLHIIYLHFLVTPPTIQMILITQHFNYV